jgi:Spy/CpxP family protein refolding chaperone
MKSMPKRILAGAAALGLGLTSVAALSAPWGDCGGWGGGNHHRGEGPGGRAAFMQQHLQRLQTYLQLKPEQQDAWKGFVSAMEANHQAMASGWRSMQQEEANAVERFNKRIQFMEARLKEMKTVAKAADNLYAVLSPAQKAVMDNFFSRPGPRSFRNPASEEEESE